MLGIERFDVARLLRGHVAHLLLGRPLGQHRKLTLVDPPGAIFAGLIDTDDPFNQRGRRRVAGQAVFGRGLFALVLARGLGWTFGHLTHEEAAAVLGQGAAGEGAEGSLRTV